MAGETIVTVVGNLTADPEMRYTQNGQAVAGFTIASTPRTFDRQKNEWVDGEALFLRCSIWRDYAENVSISLTKGMRVIAQGRLKQRSYEDKEGNKRTVVEMEVDEIGPSLRYAQASVQRIQRDHYANAQESAFQAQQAEAWATPQQAQQAGVAPTLDGFPQQAAPQQDWTQYAQPVQQAPVQQAPAQQQAPFAQPPAQPQYQPQPQGATYVADGDAPF